MAFLLNDSHVIESLCMSGSCMRLIIHSKLQKFGFTAVMWTGSVQKARTGFLRGQQLNLNRVGFSWPYIIFLTCF